MILDWCRSNDPPAVCIQGPSGLSSDRSAILDQVRCRNFSFCISLWASIVITFIQDDSMPVMLEDECFFTFDRPIPR